MRIVVLIVLFMALFMACEPRVVWLGSVMMFVHESYIYTHHASRIAMMFMMMKVISSNVSFMS